MREDCYIDAYRGELEGRKEKLPKKVYGIVIKKRPYFEVIVYNTKGKLEE
jgi:hypothetical protein